MKKILLILVILMILLIIYCLINYIYIINNIRFDLWDFLSKISSIISIIALLIGLFFLFTPRLLCLLDTKNDYIRVHVINNNISKRPIFNIFCEIILSEDETFDEKVRTIELLKDKTLYILKGKNKLPSYIFKSKDPYNIINDEIQIGNNHYKFIKVKFKVSNMIGIEKFFEIKTSIRSLNNNNFYKPNKIKLKLF